MKAGNKSDGQSQRETARTYSAGFEDGGRGHNLRNTASSLKLGRDKEGDSPPELPERDVALQEAPGQLLASRTVRMHPGCFRLKLLNWGLFGATAI